MSVSARVTAVTAAGLLVAGSLVVGGTAAAAPAPTPPGAASRPLEHAAPVGKGDRDGDRVADDLEAAVAAARPGDRVAVIVQGTTPAAAHRVAPSLRDERPLPSIHGFAGSLTAGQVTALSRAPGVTRVELDGVTRALDASGDHDYGVEAARSAFAAGDGILDGDGVGICVVDTGVDPAHEQLAGRVVGWKDWVNGRPDPYDDHGHGTHVSSIAAGSGAGSPAYGGVARGASIIAAKVLSSSGSGADADVVSAIEWCAARTDVSVISMSLGSGPSDGSDAGSRAVDAAVAAGKVVVVAAGNSGDAPGTIDAPGVATGAITVGAGSDASHLAGPMDTDSGFYLAGFSGRGPSGNPGAPTKPDVVAPGLDVVAARAGTTNGYVAYSGTSMATPFVAGVVALGLEAAPGASPAQVKAALQASAHDAGTVGPDNEWGHGLVDARAFLGALGAAPPGTAPWPAHTLLTGTVGSGTTVDVPLGVAAGGQPLGVTLRTTNGASTCVLPVGGSCWYGYEWSPDLDAYLVSPSGSVVAVSRCMLEATNGNCAAPGRVETLGVAAAVAGTWTLRVESFSGSGSYAADVFGALGPAGPGGPTPPSAPTGLTATAVSSGSIDLAWTDTSDNETGFTIERCAGAGCSSFALVTTRPAGSTGWTDTGLAASSPYSYRVRADGDAGPSAWSPTASATTQAAPPTVPAAPTGLTAAPVSSSAVALTWTDTSDNETGFTIERCAGAGCSSFAPVTSRPAGSTSWTDTGLAASSPYGYRVRADGDGGASAWTPTASATTQAAPPTVPAAPTGLTAAPVSSSAVALTWTDTSDNETAFTLERCTGVGCSSFVAVATLGAGTTSYTDSGLAASTTYRYRVGSFNVAGPSPWSAPASATTQGSASPPSAPTGLVGTAVSATRVDLRWTDTSGDEQGFRVLRCSGNRCSPVGAVATLPAGTTTWTDPGVVARTTYRYRVEAFNAAGSAASSVVTVKTPRR